jgi:hypothetical protein
MKQVTGPTFLLPAVLSLAVSGLAGCLSESPELENAFAFETIFVNDFASHAAMQVDHLGQPVVVYSQRGSSQLRTGYFEVGKTDGAWKVVDVPHMSRCSGRVSFDMPDDWDTWRDGNKRIRAVCDADAEDGNRELRFRRAVGGNGGGLHSTNRHQRIALDAGEHNAIAVATPEGDDIAIVAYYDPGAEVDGTSLRVARWNPDALSWDHEVVDGAGNVGEYVDIAIDSQNRPHLAYYSRTAREVRYVFYDGTEWRGVSPDGSAVVASGVSIDGDWMRVSQGHAIALKLDEEGGPHIAYANGSTLGYARLDEGEWQQATRRVDGGVIESLSLAVGGGHAAILYANSSITDTGSKAEAAHFKPELAQEECENNAWLFEDGICYAGTTLIETSIAPSAISTAYDATQGRFYYLFADRDGRLGLSYDLQPTAQ